MRMVKINTFVGGMSGGVGELLVSLGATVSDASDEVLDGGL
jgi:hypothetical protein